VSIDLRSQLRNGYAAAGDIVSDVEQFRLTSFNDTFVGADAAVTVFGNGGADKITGSTKSDLIIGGSGADTLKGGAGRDVFVFDAKDTSSSKKKADYILDFSGKTGDKIDLKPIDANAKTAGNQAFSFIGTEAFSKPGQVRYEKTAKDTYVLFNTDADASAEGVIRLKGSMDLQKAWFVL
jgi:Ca2+-binding RTX toxin-like protein